jgi:hypothetical protein
VRFGDSAERVERVGVVGVVVADGLPERLGGGDRSRPGGVELARAQELGGSVVLERSRFPRVIVDSGG